MKTMRLKKLLLVLMTLFVSMTAGAQTVDKGTITQSGVVYHCFYDEYADIPYYAIIGESPDATGGITIPVNVTNGSQNYKPTSMVEGAFKNNTNIKSINISANITKIAYEAFRGCTSLKTVYINAAVTSMYNYAFEGCSSLTDIRTIGSDANTVTNTLTFGQDVFSNCTSLKTVTFTNATTTPTFNGCTALESVSFPNATGIGGFEGCTALKTVDTPKAEGISGGAFSGCTSLESYTAPSTLTSVGASAFSGCTSLKYVDLRKAAAVVTSYDLTRKNDPRSIIYEMPNNTMLYVSAGYTVGTGESNIVMDGVCSNLWLVEGKNYAGSPAAPYTFTASTISYSRSLGADKVYTICLPYAAPAKDGVKYYAFDGVDGTTVKFTEVDNTARNTPYLVVTTKAVSNFNVTSPTTVSSSEGAGYSTVGDYRFQGTKSKLSPAETVGNYILQADNKWQKAEVENASVYINPFRAYIKPMGAGARSLDMEIDGYATGINQITTVDKDGTQQYFDLSGHRLSQPKKGINIVNGKKVVIK